MKLSPLIYHLYMNTVCIPNAACIKQFIRPKMLYAELWYRLAYESGCMSKSIEFDSFTLAAFMRYAFESSQQLSTKNVTPNIRNVFSSFLIIAHN